MNQPINIVLNNNGMITKQFSSQFMIITNSNGTELDDQIKSAEQFHDSLDFEKSMLAYEQSLILIKDSKNKKKSEIYCRIGNLFFDKNNKNKDFEKAKQYYSKAITIDEKNPIFYCNIGITEDYLQNFDQAIIYFEKCLSLLKNDQIELKIKTYERIAKTLFKMKNYKKLSEILNTLKDIFPNSKYLNLFKEYQ